MFWQILCVCVFNLITGTQVYYRSRHSRYLRYPGRVFILCHSFVLDLNHSDQRNSFYLQKVKYSYSQIWKLHLGMNVCIIRSNLPHFFNSCPNPSSFSNSLQSDLLSKSVNLGSKLLDLSRSELFQTFMLFFILNLSFFSLIQSFPDLIYRSP